MLTAHMIGGCRALGADADSGEVEIPQLFIDRYKYLELASEDIVTAFSSVTAIMSITGGAAPDILQQYNTALDFVTPPIERIVEERNAIDGVVPAKASLPLPVFVETNGLGFVPVSVLTTALPAVTPNFIPAAKIRFGAQAEGDLGDAIGWLHDYYVNSHLIRQQAEQLRQQFGAATLVVIAVIAAVAFLAWTVHEVFVSRYTSLSNQEASRADAKRAEQQARTTKIVMRAYEKSLAVCAQQANTPAAVAKCIETAGKAAKAAGEGVPDMPTPTRRVEKEGRGFISWLGILTLGAVILGGGIFLYKRRERIKSALQRTGTLKPPTEQEGAAEPARQRRPSPRGI